MALFKILKGNSNNLATQAVHEGYCYVTTDTYKMYVDIDSSTRIALNAEQADVATLALTANKLNVNAGDIATPVYFENGIPKECSLSITAAGSETVPVYINENGIPKPVSTSNENPLRVSISGNAGSASKLDINNVGGIDTPVYFVNGIPLPCTSLKVGDYLPLSGGTLTGPLALTENIGYGTTLPEDGINGQLFFLEDDTPAISSVNITGFVTGTGVLDESTGIISIETSVGSGGSGNSLDLDITGNAATSTLSMKTSSSASSGKIYVAGVTGDNASLNYNTSVYCSGTVLYGACWNDYAEYRIFKDGNNIPYGRVVIENGDDTLSLSTERLQGGGNICSDTFGFSIGETDKAKMPIAVAGRVLVYPYEDREYYKPGDAVCSGPNGTVSKMTREEIREWPDRIIGYVSAIPQYETWGENNILVNNRIWIKVK